MKKRLFVSVLILIMLASGCGVHPAPSPTESETVTTDFQTVPEDVTEPETVTEEVTEPETTVPETSVAETTVPETTEPETTAPPVTEATEPTVPPTTKPQEPAKPAETKPKPSTKPSDNTKPITPTKPTEPTKPTKPSKPAETKPAETKPAETKPVETQPAQTEPALRGWQESNGKRYYYDSDGSLHIGWLELDGARYYFLDDGTMATGCVRVPGDGKRHFASNGKEVILVNPWNYVPDDYSVKLSKYGDYKVASVCLDDLKDMLADCKSAGNKAIVCSAYRSHSYQKGLYERRVQRFLDQGYSQEKAEEEAAKRVAIPGTSEHQLGLAVDIVDVNYQVLDKEQENTAAQKWLMANSWRYGFILRYPNNKSSVTGIIYEPWHYRYVGKELAKEIYNSGLCLEEYFINLT